MKILYIEDNDDKATDAIAKQTLDNDFKWLEEGIIT